MSDSLGNDYRAILTANGGLTVAVICCGLVVCLIHHKSALTLVPMLTVVEGPGTGNCVSGYVLLITAVALIPMGTLVALPSVGVIVAESGCKLNLTYNTELRLGTSGLIAGSMAGRIYRYGIS